MNGRWADICDDLWSHKISPYAAKKKDWLEFLEKVREGRLCLFDDFYAYCGKPVTNGAGGFCEYHTAANCERGDCNTPAVRGCLGGHDYCGAPVCKNHSYCKYHLKRKLTTQLHALLACRCHRIRSTAAQRIAQCVLQGGEQSGARGRRSHNRNRTVLNGSYREIMYTNKIMYTI